MFRTFAVLIGLTILATVCKAQSPQDVERLDAAVYQAWQKTPLFIRTAVLVSKPPEGFGLYEARPSNAFKAGEPIVAYAEPAAYGWKEISKGFYEFGFNVDFVVKKADGKIIGGKDNFAKLIKQSRVRNREFMLVLTLTLSGVDPGDYVLEYKLRDVTGDKSTSFQLPFKIEG